MKSKLKNALEIKIVGIVRPKKEVAATSLHKLMLTFLYMKKLLLPFLLHLNLINIFSVTVIVNMISYVLIAFVGISLIVSSIMIGIITYISVLERVKEIGILRWY